MSLARPTNHPPNTLNNEAPHSFAPCGVGLSTNGSRDENHANPREHLEVLHGGTVVDEIGVCSAGETDTH